MVKELTEYQKKLLDPHWQEKRKIILYRDDFTCRSCGCNSSVLHVHHKYYIPGLEPWEYANDLLMTLCEACHSIHHMLNGLDKKVYPGLFLPPFKAEKKVAYSSDFLRDDYFLTNSEIRKIPMSVIRQYKFIVKVNELAISNNQVSFKNVIAMAYDKLNDLCIRSNVKIITELGVFGDGDVTDLKPDQFLL